MEKNHFSLVGKKVSKIVSFIYEFEGEASILKIGGVWSKPSLPLLPGPLWPRAVVPVRVSSIGQIYLFENYFR